MSDPRLQSLPGGGGGGGGQIFAFCTDFEKLSRRSSSFAQRNFLQQCIDHPSNIQPSEA